MKKTVCVILVILMTACFCSCTVVSASSDYSKEFDINSAVFSAKLLRACGAGDGRNVVISPASVLIALGMTAGGADGNTLAELERALCGENMTLDVLNADIGKLCTNLAGGGTCRVNIANSIWIRGGEGGPAISPDFLKLSKDVYRTDVFKESFGDSALVKINSWVREKTDGKIKDITSEIDPLAIMYLINAVAFDGKWETALNPYGKMSFTAASGQSLEAEFMSGAEKYYIKTDNAVGFAKDYTGGQYKFVALVPNSNVTFFDFIKGVDGEYIRTALEKIKREKVDVYLPKFKCEYGNELSAELIKMGIKDAFDNEKADFSALGCCCANGNIFVGRVDHRAYIEIDESGTKAGAATIVQTYCNGSDSPSDSRKTVYFTRPFIYMIVESDSGLPLFIGTYENGAE